MLFLTSIILIIYLVSLVSAFGVATSHFEGNPLEIFPGETKTIQLSLQTSLGEDKTVMVQAETLNDLVTLSLTNTLYQVSPNELVFVPIEVTAPFNAVPGQTYQPVAIFTEVVDDCGSFCFGVGYNVQIPVLIKQPINQDSDNDGVLDSNDVCSNTNQGEKVNNDGCSILQMCDPVKNSFTNRREYLACVKETGNEFLQNNIITFKELKSLIKKAARFHFP